MFICLVMKQNTWSKNDIGIVRNRLISITFGIQDFSLNNWQNREKSSKNIKDVNNTINQCALNVIYRTLYKSRMHTLFKYTQNIYQDRPYSEPQNKSQ